MATEYISDLTELTSPDKDDLLEVETAVATSRKIKMKNSIAGRLPVFTDATRGAAATAGRVIWNSDDGKPNFDTGAAWVLADGTTT